MESNPPNASGFVAAVLARVKTDNNKERAFRAIMSRADNPAFESLAWEYLIPYCNINNDFERIPFALIGAAIARIRPDQNGTADIGESLSSICKDDGDKERESRRFRRLIACDSVLELCPLLHSVLSYLASKGAAIDYIRLLMDLLYWNQKTKLRWAVSFYGKSAPAEEESQS